MNEEFFPLGIAKGGGVLGGRRVGGRRGHGLSKTARRRGPPPGRRFGLFWPGPVYLSAAGAVLGIRRRAV